VHAWDQDKNKKIIDLYGREYYVNIPGRFNMAKTNYNYNYCENDTEMTSGEILFSMSKMKNQTSCVPKAQNAGNWYSYKAAVADKENVGSLSFNSVCSKNWQLPSGSGNYEKSYNRLITVYPTENAGFCGNSNNDCQILWYPLSFVRSGGTEYNWASQYSRGAYDIFWQGYNRNTLSTRFDYNAAGIGGGSLKDGFSLRCGIRYAQLGRSCRGGWNNLLDLTLRHKCRNIVFLFP